MYPNASPVTVYEPSSIKVGETATVTVAFGLFSTQGVDVRIYAPNFSTGGFCVIVSPCTFNVPGLAPGTAQVTATGLPYCANLQKSQASASITIK
jgi:hypothetical protein